MFLLFLTLKITLHFCRFELIENSVLKSLFSLSIWIRRKERTGETDKRRGGGKRPKNTSVSWWKNAIGKQDGVGGEETSDGERNTCNESQMPFYKWDVLRWKRLRAGTRRKRQRQRSRWSQYGQDVQGPRVTGERTTGDEYTRCVYIIRRTITPSRRGATNPIDFPGAFAFS